ASNNTTVSAGLPVSLTPPPDLLVTTVTVPANAVEGAIVDVSWTVRNDGAGAANGSWVDRVYLQKAGNPTAPKIEVGTFIYTGPLGVGVSYTRSEGIRLPTQVNDLYTVIVTTNAGNDLYEHGATANNSRSSEAPVAVSAMPRPDLRVSRVVA